jgi:hypothetical protein
MANEGSSSKAGLVIGALILGGVVGYLIGKLPHGNGDGTQNTNLCATPGNQILDITPTSGEPSCAQATISEGAGQQVVWQSEADTYPWIRFVDANTFPTLNIQGSTVRSGPVGPMVTPPGEFKYMINVLRKGTPTPEAKTPTPTPQTYGRIIINR